MAVEHLGAAGGSSASGPSVDPASSIALMRDVGKVLSDKQVATLLAQSSGDIKAAGDLWRTLVDADKEDNEPDPDLSGLDEGAGGIIYRDEFWDKSKREWRSEAKTASKPRALGASVLVVRQRFDDKMLPQETVVEIRGPRLAGVMRALYAEAEGVNVAGDKITLGPDYFFWARDFLQQARAYAFEHSDKESLTEIDVALRFVKEHFGSRAVDMIGDGVISFDELSAILPPNVLVVGQRHLGDIRVYRVKNHHRGKDSQGKLWRYLQVAFNDFDGQMVGTAHDMIKIPHFAGVLPIASLPFVPLHMHPKRDEIWEKVLARTKRQFTLFKREGQVYEHEGAGLVSYRDQFEQWVEPQKFKFTGRVMVDPLHMGRVEPEMLIPELSVLSASPEVVVSRDATNGKHVGVKDVMSTLGTKPTVKRVAASKASALASNVTYDELNDDERVLFSGLVYGYSLADSKWGVFSIENIKPVVWNHGAFQDLVMDKDLKDLICQLISSQHLASLDTDDIVQGKGKGLIGLLFGKPGVGKTLTAEAIAETAETPLFMISSGALGHTADKISDNLAKLLDLAAHWRAVLLLDEADVFLNCRNDSDMERNAVVTVFLRQLEYYQGILLLTTNRAETIDPAFQSRIHFCYQYPSLDKEARKRIWKTFTAKSQASGVIKVQLSEADLENLAEMDNNGRQIKNIHSIAAKLAAVSEDKILDKAGILRTVRVLQNWIPTRQL